jgi:hypothetical protein
VATPQKKTVPAGDDAETAIRLMPWVLSMAQLSVQADLYAISAGPLRRRQARKPPNAITRPGIPAPTIGPGTGDAKPCASLKLSTVGQRGLAP